MAIKKKVIVIPAVALVLAGGGLYACSSLSKMSQNLPGMEYTVVKASKNDLSQMISTTGKVIGNGKVDVTTKLTCTVAEVKVSLGDHVKEGDVLCVFDSTDLEEEYESLKKQLSNSDLKEEDGHNKNERDLQAAQTKKQTAIERA
ncbi:MAG: biotin/lipoyl-binding protein, partial [Ruminococcus sp.]|nr:biotin/lipoyl-binding protein [Ruminococcus sp.]